MEIAPQTSNVVRAILDEAREWLDTPYHHQQSIKGQATDCIGLVVGVASNIGLLNQRDRLWISKNFSGYARSPQGDLLRRGFGAFLPEYHVDDMQPGDVLLISMNYQPRHCAIYTENNTIIHAYAERGRCVEHRYAHYWRRMTLAAYRLAEVDPKWDS